MASLAARSAYARPLGELLRPGARLGVDVVRRHHPVDQADAQRLLGVDEAAGEDQVLGARRTDEPGEPLGAAGTGDDPQQDLRLTELGVVARRCAGRRTARARSRRRARSR